MVDIAVIGAGLAGLICARQLQQVGYQVVVIEKSRGLGGRVATRRLQDTCADHGVRYLEDQGELSQQLIQILSDRQILHPWLKTPYQLEAETLHPTSPSLRYAASAGITSVAKFLATDLEIWRGQRVIAIAPATDQWELQLEPTAGESIPNFRAKALVVAIPAPQALALIEPLSSVVPTNFLKKLRSVEFEPCLSAIATYPTGHQQDLANLAEAITFPKDSDLTWLSIESSKRPGDRQPVIVAQSSPEFAQRYLDTTDLQLAGQHLLEQAAKLGLPWLNTPETLQVHRWRYAFASQPLADQYLETNAPLPLVCSGDWCGGRQTENALRSGREAAITINQQLEQRSMPPINLLL
ncbi:FAD-dependent oxidoreductase [Oculatella sp. FACHB-28]|uniref:NAD(P)/FAD-dependent oxidoreductase n=1 Tax=Oculatella sp. FACHB-28 TaxID=2692845 RepID=UPI001682BA9E|nr:FAD-dependent oxidoreductase [Oculatella sp. FACHB-28]MBD2055921.1 FAD-dependent oxidoreductase [Oculatella sp. FACHB-28]